MPPPWSAKIYAPLGLRFPKVVNELAVQEGVDVSTQHQPHPEQVDPLYLFACYVEWENRGEPGAAWELISAAESGHEDTSAHARALLTISERLLGDRSEPAHAGPIRPRHKSVMEETMKTPYGLEIIERCAACNRSRPGFFCGFSAAVLNLLDRVSHHSILPAGAILFVEGQMPRGMFVLCSGRVKLSTTSRDGKVLILKTAEAGEVLGLSAAIAGSTYEMTAETATPCQLDFVDRTNLMKLLESESELGLHAAQWLSREFEAAYHDIHDLLLARSSSGKLARLLLSCTPGSPSETSEVRLRSVMTHEEMAQRIGSSRETVTRLLSDLKRKDLIRSEGSTLVIRNRIALEALAV
jgi:CRP/FNR family transcriptional regulator, cyclic AMP receptor protein